MCDHWQARGDYYVDGRGRLDCWCKPCRNAYSLAQHTIRYRTDAAFRDRCRVRNRRYSRQRTRQRREARAWRAEQARDLVRRARLVGGTQARLAAVLGTSQAHVSGWHTGRVHITQRRLDDLRAAVRQMETQR